MRYKRRVTSVMLTLMLAGSMLWSLTEEPARAETGQILVIYPDVADRRGEEDGPAAVARALVSLGYAADFMEAGRAAETVQNYDRIIWCATAESERMDPAMLADYEGKLLTLGDARGLQAFGIQAANSRAGLAGYRFADDYDFEASVTLLHPGRIEPADYSAGRLYSDGKEMPLVSAREGIRCISLRDFSSGFGQAVLTQEIAEWLWPYESRMHVYSEHVVLDAVYPFSDPYRLKNTVDYMAEKRMNFVISVMPVYEHADYPAMGQLCEVLRYAQANGGAVVLHAPIIQNDPDAETLAERLTAASRSYLENDVYPLALEIPSEWMFDDTLLPILGRYRTLFIREMDAFAKHSPGEYPLKDFLKLGTQNVYPALGLEQTGVSHLTCYSAAVYLNLAELEEEDVRKRIDAVKDSPVAMLSLWDMPQTVYMNEGGILVWDLSTLSVDGEQRFNRYEPREYSSDFNYRRNIYYRSVANLQNQNYMLIGISAVTLMVFILLVMRSRRQMHRRFLISKTTDTEGKE